MRVLTFILVGVLFCTGSAEAKFDPLKCYKKSMEGYESIFQKAGWSSDKMMEAIKDPFNQNIAALQHSLLPSVGIPQNFEPAKVSKSKTKDGQDQELVSIGLPNFDGSILRDPAKKKKAVAERCAEIAPNVVDICVKTFFAKEQYVSDFIKHFESSIQQMAKQQEQNPDPDWAKLAAGQNFDFRNSEDPDLAATVYLSQEKLMELAYQRGAIVRIADQKGNFNGYALKVCNSQKRADYFYIPGSRGERNPWMNPYYFVFGGIPASEWNSHWKVDNVTVPPEMAMC